MLDLVDETLEGLLRAQVPLSAQDVDVSFEPPEEEWSAKLNRPTVNLFLWDVRRSSTAARTGTEMVERGGVLNRRLALPRIELQYLITVWTADHGDQRALLSNLLRVVLSYNEIPSTFVPTGLQHLPGMTVALARTNDPREQLSLHDRFKTGLNVVVTAAVETDAMTAAGPPTSEIGFGVRNRNNDAYDVPPRRVAGEVMDPAAVGLAITSPRGRGTVNAAGRFLVPAAAGDEVMLHTDPPRTAVVPAEGGIVFP